MKKLLALLSLTAFLAVSVHAQTSQQTAPAAKKETVAKSDSKAPASCCMKANAACCKNKDAKTCTAAQKAECAKASGSKECSHAGASGKSCDHDHAKASTEKVATPESK